MNELYARKVIKSLLRHFDSIGRRFLLTRQQFEEVFLLASPKIQISGIEDSDIKKVHALACDKWKNLIKQGSI